ncbi:GNAT family N-acetyltransferase [Arthrobacter psychrolactophilus]
MFRWLELRMISEAELWPPFELQLSTPRLRLRVIRDGDIPAMVDAALSGIHPPEAMPFSFPWTQAPDDELPTNTAQHVWRARAEMSKDRWSLQFGVWQEDEFIGCQDLGASNFHTLKTVITGSWLRQGAQGRGFGKEMRSAVLSYAFDYLGADAAESEAASWNSSSLGVSHSLGYTDNGILRHSWTPGKITEAQQLRLKAEAFARPAWPLAVTGSEATAAYLGITPANIAR